MKGRSRWPRFLRALMRRVRRFNSTLTPKTGYPFSAQEIIYSYQLILGRVPEPDALLAKAAHPLREGLAILLESEEFANRVMEPISRGSPPIVDRPICSRALSGWVGKALPLSRGGRRQLRSVRLWSDLIGVVLSDRIFRGYLSDSHGAWFENGFLVALRERSRSVSRHLVGVVESFDGVRVSGWAVDANNPQQSLQLEVHADGVLVGHGNASAMRADIKEICAVPGLCGFTIDLSSARLYANGRIVRVEVREATTGHLIGERIADMDPDRQAAAGQNMADAQSAPAGSQRQAVPQASYPLEAYTAYHRRVYGEAGKCQYSGSDSPRFGIIMHIGLDVGRSERMLRSISNLNHTSWLSVIVGEQASFRDDRLVDVLDGADGAQVLLIEVDSTISIGSRLNAAAAATECDFLLFADQIAFDPDVLDWLIAAACADPMATIIYWDEDEVDWSSQGEEHQSPRFKSRFDPVWLLQQNFIGHSFAIARSLFQQVGGFRDDLEDAGYHDLLLRATARSGRRAVHHVERVLHSRPVGVEPYPVSLAAAADHLRLGGWPAVAERNNDIVGSARPGMLRIRPDLAHGSVAVIIATHDRPDLVGPCVASLRATRGTNRASFHITVVDHASVLPEALAQFRRLREEGVDVRRYDGPFNWAAINNRGAEAQSADVLVFLNDDTLVLAPGWCDELYLHAMRPDAGAVGARLLYPDDSVQHAGMLLHGGGATPHEGLGLPTTDGGYLGRLAVAHEVSAVTGACLATRRTVFEAHDGFDAASFPVTYNDVDYCVRVRESGLAVRYTPHAAFYHFESQSRGFDVTPERRARHELELRAFVEKWPCLPERDPFYNVHFDRYAAPYRRLIALPEYAQRTRSDS